MVGYDAKLLKCLLFFLLRVIGFFIVTSLCAGTLECALKFVDNFSCTIFLCIVFPGERFLAFNAFGSKLLDCLVVLIFCVDTLVFYPELS